MGGLKTQDFDAKIPEGIDYERYQDLKDCIAIVANIKSKMTSLSFEY